MRGKSLWISGALVAWLVSVGGFGAKAEEGGAPYEIRNETILPASPIPSTLFGQKLDLALPGVKRSAFDNPRFRHEQTSFRTTLWRQGDHRILLQGSSSLIDKPGSLGLTEKTQSLNASLTYRYEGLAGGIIRPVARLSVVHGQGFMPGGRGSMSALLPEAGLEIVYKGVGLGMTLGYPLATTSRTPYTPMGNPMNTRRAPLPHPAKSKRKSGFDWEALWNNMSKNLYIVVEDPRSPAP